MRLPRSLAGKPLTKFRTARYRRIPVIYGIMLNGIRHNNHHTVESRRLKIDDLENVGFPARFLEGFGMQKVDYFGIPGAQSQPFAAASPGYVFHGDIYFRGALTFLRIHLKHQCLGGIAGDAPGLLGSIAADCMSRASCIRASASLFFSVNCSCASILLLLFCHSPRIRLYPCEFARPIIIGFRAAFRIWRSGPETP